MRRAHQQAVGRACRRKRPCPAGRASMLLPRLRDFSDFSPFRKPVVSLPWVCTIWQVQKNYSVAVELTNPPPPWYLRVCNNKLLPIYLTTNLLPPICHLVTCNARLVLPTQPSSLLSKSGQVSWRGGPAPSSHLSPLETNHLP